MKIRQGYLLRKVMDAYVIIGVGSAVYNPNRIMSLNETGAFLWQLLETDTDQKELTDRLMQEYDVDARTAEEDVTAFLTDLREKELITE